MQKARKELEVRLRQIDEVREQGIKALCELETFYIMLERVQGDAGISSPAETASTIDPESVHKAAEKLMKPPAPEKKKRGRPKGPGSPQNKKDKEGKRNGYRANRGAETAELKEKCKDMTKEERKEFLQDLYDKRKKAQGEL